MTSQMDEVVPGAGKCLMKLTSTVPGKEAAFADNTLVVLNKLLHSENADIYTAAASAIMFCTVLTKSKILASRIESLPSRLVAIAKSTHDFTAQLYALKVSSSTKTTYFLFVNFSLRLSLTFANILL